MADGSMVERLAEKREEFPRYAVFAGIDVAEARWWLNAIADELERESARLTASTLTQANRINPPSFQWLRAQASRRYNDEGN